MSNNEFCQLLLRIRADVAAVNSIGYKLNDGYLRSVITERSENIVRELDYLLNCLNSGGYKSEGNYVT